MATILELIIVGRRMNLDLENMVRSVITMAKVDGMDQKTIEAIVVLIKYNNVTPFDAFHAILCKDEIISSDHVYDRIGIKRIEL